MTVDRSSAVTLLDEYEPGQNVLVCNSSTICNLSCMCCLRQIQTEIRYVAKSWLLSLGVISSWNHKFALSNVAHTTFLRMITLGKPTEGFKGFLRVATLDSKS